MPQVIHNKGGNAEALSCLLGRRANYPAGLRIRIHFIRIQIQHFRLNRVPTRIQSGSRALMTKN
jgi:hypothetical protein